MTIASDTDRSAPPVEVARASEPVEICAACGQLHVPTRGGRPCRAHVDEEDGTRRPCRGQASLGASVCHAHGGLAPQVRAAGRRRQQEQAAAEAVRRVLDDPNAPPVTDPVGELLALGGRARAALDEIGQRVNNLEQRIRYESPGAGLEQLRAEVGVWERMMSQLHRILVDLSRLDLDERRVRLDEARAALAERVLTAILDALYAELVGMGLPDELARAWPRLVEVIAPREIKALTARPAVDDGS